MYRTDMPKKDQSIANITTNLEEIKICLFENDAPNCVENLMTHAKEEYCDGTVFHRVIKDFMIQGEDPQGSGYGGESIWKKSFENEFSENLKNIRGALSMASFGPNTSRSQFLIVQNNSIRRNYIKYLDECDLNEEQKDFYENSGGRFWLGGKHSVFGQVFEGVEIADKITRVDTDFSDKSLEDIIINSIEISRS